MSSFVSSSNNAAGFVDHATGKKVMNIMKKYMGAVLNEETCDKIMDDVRKTFGENHDAQVMIDTDTYEIEITVRDSNHVLMKCSSLTLFKDWDWPSGGYGEGKL